MKNKLNADLFWTFFKIGLFTFGGGYAMIALIENICVEKKKWITHDEMTNLTVLAEITPGPIAINCATFVGYKKTGIFGAAAATLGVSLPSFLIILAISALLDRFSEIKAVQSAFAGIRIAIGLIIVSAAVNMIKKMMEKTKKKVFSIAILAVSFAAILSVNIFGFKLSSIALMAFSAAAGLIYHIAVEKSKEKDGGKNA